MTDTIYKNTTIGGVKVELEAYDETVNGYCSKTVGGVEYTGSIAILDGHGVLEDSYGNELSVNRAIIDRIVNWAIKNGW